MPSLLVCFRNEKGGIKLGGTDMTRDNEFNDLYANGMYAFVNENYEISIELFTQAAEINPDNKLVFVSKGAAHLKLDRAEEALHDINRAIAIDENYAKAYHIRGLINEKIGNDNEALSDFTHAIDLGPGVRCRVQQPCHPPHQNGERRSGHGGYHGDSEPDQHQSRILRQ
jgi:tetratricopeptide (TPR) repeat protein